MPSESTIPAMPLMVSAAWNDVSTPNVKKKLRMRALLATIPGMKPYMTHMNTIRSTKATIHAVKPAWIDAEPSDGPTVSSCTMVVGAGILPLFSTFERSLVSSGVNWPEICEMPLGISLWMTGALYTRPSSTMATGRFRLLRVMRAHSRAPSEFIVMETIGL